MTNLATLSSGYKMTLITSISSVFPVLRCDSEFPAATASWRQNAPKRWCTSRLDSRPRAGEPVKVFRL